ncbi:MAG: hypothetical protein DRJ40_08615 [Thermoprotei archaeon]|nr:MAG: hypothetical protein DRJ40_08615 [Thermoprotei archaeon]
MYPEDIREYVAGLINSGESPYVIRDITKALKKFIKVVITPREPYLGKQLYESFRMYRPEQEKVNYRPLTLEEVKAIFNRLWR